MIDGENRGPAGPLGRFERPEIRLLGGCQTHSGVSGGTATPDLNRTRGEPWLSHIMNRHQVRCRSLRAVVSSVDSPGVRRSMSLMKVAALVFRKLWMGTGA